MRAGDCQPGWWVRFKHYEGRIQWIERCVGCGVIVVHFEDGRVVKFHTAEHVVEWWP